MKKVLLTLSGLALVMSSYAADVTGKYNGKLTVDFTKTKGAIKAQGDKAGGKKKEEAAQIIGVIDAQTKIINGSILKLELKKGGTLTMVQTVNGKTENETGKWTLNGSVITFSNLSGKNGGPKELKGTVSKDGKSLTFDLSNELKAQTAKQFPGMPSPTGKLTFKKG